MANAPRPISTGRHERAARAASAVTAMMIGKVNDSLPSFAAFVLSLGHALAVGSDLRGAGGPALALLAAAPVLWLGFYWLLVPRAQFRRVASVRSTI